MISGTLMLVLALTEQITLSLFLCSKKKLNESTYKNSFKSNYVIQVQSTSISTFDMKLSNHPIQRTIQ